MRESLKQFRCELELGIHGRCFLAPALAHVGTNVPIKAGIDLAAVKKLGQIFERMDLSLFEVSGVDHPFPVLVGKPGSSNKNITHCLSITYGHTRSISG